MVEHKRAEEKSKPTTKARKLENTKKGKGVHETLFFRVFVVGVFCFSFCLLSSVFFC